MTVVSSPALNETIEKAKAAIEHEDYDAAIELLRPLAHTGVADAEFLMGYLFFTSANVTKDDSRAWLERAAAKNHPEALYYLAGLGRSGVFGPPEDDVQQVFLVRAAELGSALAQRDLGCLYATGEDGFPKDEVLGRLWYGRAAEQGHADAQYNYGLMLLYGEGGPAEPDAGMEWVRRAAAQGDPCATHFFSQFPATIRRYSASYLSDLVYGAQPMTTELAEVIRMLRRDHSVDYVRLGFYLCETDPDAGGSFGLGKALTALAAIHLQDHDRAWI